MKFDLNSLLLLVVLVCAADAVFALLGGRIPFCTVVSVELTVGLWSRLLLKSAKYRTMKAVCSSRPPPGCRSQRIRRHGTDCIFRVPGDRAAFTTQLEMPDAAKRCARICTPAAAR